MSEKRDFPTHRHHVTQHGEIDEEDNITYWTTCDDDNWRSRVFKKTETALKHWLQHAGKTDV